MKITREWAMPNKNTFSIKPIKSLITDIKLCEELRFTAEGRPYSDYNLIIDPFVGNSPFKDYCRSNDLNPEIKADFNMDALSFLKTFETACADMILFDPPYSPRQVSECYKKMDKTVNMQTTQSSFWGNMKKEISRIVKPMGVVITCGWNSGGIGKTNGFEIEEILLIAHGGWHNDTIVTVERRINGLI